MHWHDPRWILVAWLVVAVASALRFWRITGPFVLACALSNGWQRLTRIRHVNRLSAPGESVTRLTRSE